MSYILLLLIFLQPWKSLLFSQSFSHSGLFFLLLGDHLDLCGISMAWYLETCVDVTETDRSVELYEVPPAGIGICTDDIESFSTFFSFVFLFGTLSIFLQNPKVTVEPQSLRSLSEWLWFYWGFITSGWREHHPPQSLQYTIEFTHQQDFLSYSKSNTLIYCRY